MKYIWLKPIYFALVYVSALQGGCQGEQFLLLQISSVRKLLLVVQIADV